MMSAPTIYEDLTKCPSFAGHAVIEELIQLLSSEVNNLDKSKWLCHKERLLHILQILNEFMKNVSQNEVTLSSKENIVNLICMPLLKIISHCDQAPNDRLLLTCVIDLLVSCLNQICEHQNVKSLQVVIEMCCASLRDADNVMDRENSDSLNISCTLEVIHLLSIGLIGSNFNKEDVRKLWNKLFEEFLSLLDTAESKIAGTVVGTIIVLLLQEDKSKLPNKLSRLWSMIQRVNERQLCEPHNEKNEKPLLLLCALADFYFPIDGRSHDPNIQSDEKFWEILQSGMCQHHSITRKRAIYLLKRIVDINFHHGGNSDASDSNQVFWWDMSEQKELAKVWEDFIVFLEMLEEKQVHIIQPIFPRMQLLLKYSHERESGPPFLHTSWLTVIFQRCAIHESNTVVRWSMLQLLRVDMLTCPMLKQGQNKYLCNSFLKNLQENKLYCRSPGASLGSCPEVGSALSNFFLSCWSSLKNTDQRCVFFKSLLKKITEETWSSVPLLFLTRAIANLPAERMLDLQAIQYIRDIASTKLLNMEVYTRSAIQSYLGQAVISLSNMDFITPQEMGSIVVAFPREEIFMRGDKIWNKYVNLIQAASTTSGINSEAWSKTAVTRHLSSTIAGFVKPLSDSNSLHLDSLVPLQLVRLLLLAADAQILCSMDNSSHQLLPLNHILLPVVDVMHSINSHAYMPPVQADRTLQLLTALCDECSKCDDNDDKICKAVNMLVSGCLQESLQFIMMRVTSDIKEIHDLPLVALYANFITTIFNCLRHSELGHLLAVVSDCSLALNNKNIIKTDMLVPMRRLAAMEILATVAKISTEKEDDCPENESLASLSSKLCGCIQNLDLDLQFCKPTPSQHGDNDNLDHREWGKIVSRFLTNQWRCVQYLLKHSSSSIDPIRMMERCREAFTIASGDCSVPIMHCMRYLIPLVLSKTREDHVIACLDLGWKKLKEDARTTMFWPELQAYISMAFQTSLLEYEKGSQINNNVIKYAEELMLIGEDRIGVTSTLINQICSVFKQPRMIQHAQTLIDILVSAVLYGNVHKKSERCWLDTCCFLESEESDCIISRKITNPAKDDHLVRVTVINLLASLKLDSPSHVSLAENMIERLMQKHRVIARENAARHFVNSLPHRQKHRIVQMVLMLEPFINEALCAKVWPYIWESLGFEVQPSIRYLLEWLIMRLVKRYPQYITTMWGIMKEFSDKKHLSLCSLLSVLSQLGTHLKAEQQESFFLVAIPSILPWCMAHHFNTRIHSQATLTRLWQQCQSLGLDDIISKYAVVESCLFSSDPSKNSLKNTKKLLESYLFHVFNFERDFSIETLFHTFPRLTCISDDEWIHPDFFAELDATWCQNGGHVVPLYSSSDELKQCEPGSWRLRGQVAEEMEDETEMASGDFQKKIMPWRLMSPELELQMDDINKQKQHPAGQLVLVTSLIDKVPNLGGLCRTAEIFGVSQYVVGNLKYVEDKTFQSLSVTAHKWIPIVEVSPFLLKDYLLEKRQDGYTLVGVEQTASSVCLTRYSFPVKTLLVLGNEKEGIPVDLINLLDVCVEIPQQGVIRSLNVHVSGALLVWEYTRQQLLKTGSEST